MLDLSFVRDNLPLVEEKLRQRGMDPGEVLKDFRAIDTERRQAITETETMKATITAITEELTKLEGRVDDLHDIGLRELFLKHRNANTMDFIVGAEIYDHLEKVADRFDDVANEINSIMIEQV